MPTITNVISELVTLKAKWEKMFKGFEKFLVFFIIIIRDRIFMFYIFLYVFAFLKHILAFLTKITYFGTFCGIKIRSLIIIINICSFKTQIKNIWIIILKLL